MNPEHHVTIRKMATEHILALLIAERDKLNAAIEALKGSALPHATPAASAPTHGKRKFTPAQRRKQAARMKAYWAAKKAAAASTSKQRAKAA